MFCCVRGRDVFCPRGRAQLSTPSPCFSLLTARAAFEAHPSRSESISRGWAGQGCRGARQAPASALQKGFLLLRSQEENKIQYLQSKGPARQCCIAIVIHHGSIILRSNKGHFKEVKSLTKYIENLRHFKDLWKHFTWGLLGSFSLAWLWGPGESWLNCLGQTEQILSSP